MSNAGRESELGEAGNVVDAQLLHHSLAVAANGLQAEIEQNGDILAGLALGDKAKDLELAGRERFERAAIAGFEIAALDADQQAVGDLGAEVGPAAGDGAEGVQQLAG